MKTGFLVFAVLFFTRYAGAQKIVPIWPGTAPGVEKWNWSEKTDSTEIPGDPLTYNIVQPTLTYYPADPAVANGTSLIICPGGGFYYLHIKTEGTDVAEWLNKKGVAAFILKYRVVHIESDKPVKERTEKAKDTSSRKQIVSVVPMGIEDARQAVSYVREHADQFRVAKNRIGIMGFSAGGTLAVASAFNYTAANRPDFVAPVYPYVPPALSTKVLKDAPPLFIAAATDDEYHLVPMSIDLYSKWLAAGLPAEIHIYSRGGHGFGMTKLNQPSDSWIERFGDWLGVQGLLKKQ